MVNGSCEAFFVTWVSGTHRMSDLMARPSSKSSNISVLGVVNSGAPSIVPRAFKDENAAERPLEPIERISEVLFGLIMVLTITCSFSIAEADRKDVRTMLLGALGCNLAWGIIDGFMYLMGCLSSRGQNIIALRALLTAPSREEAHQVIADALPPVVASVLSEAELESLRQKLKELPEPPQRPKLAKKDWLGALAVFLLVSLSTFPVVMPFIFVTDARLALRISNGIALLLLFLTGYAFGRQTGHRPWRMGLLMVLIGFAMVGLAMALGG
jgi:VIT family